MKKISITIGALLISAMTLSAAENHADSVIAEVLVNVAKLKAAMPDAVPMAFWNFDGTIIKGDVSEGLGEGESDGKAGFKGLVEETILAGMCPVYKGESGCRQFCDVDYPRMTEIGKWLAYPYVAQIYDGVETDALDAFCARKVSEVYSKFYFKSSVKILRELEKAGVENYIVSASPEIFVRNAMGSLGLPINRARGIRVEVAGGRLTTRIVYPVPFGEGKVENVRDLVLARPNGVAVAGFGNSYSTDGNFLKYIVTQRLPGGAKGFAMMINGGAEKPGFEGLFRLVNQEEL